MKLLPLLLLATALSAQADLVEQFFDDYYFRFSPTSGTSAGFHQYDTRLEDYSKSAIQQQIAVARRFESEFVQQPKTDDREMILSKIRADLLTLESIRPWQTNPDLYSGGVTSSVYVIMNRNFASQEDRLRSVIARERLMPTVFDAARANLGNPPRIYTEIALEQLPGIVSFFQRDVPAAFTKVSDKKELAEFSQSNQAVIKALNAYHAFLKNDLLPRSKGSFPVGSENYRKKLLFEEMVDTPLDELLKIGFANLHENQASFRRIAAQVDAKRPPANILRELVQDHPAPGNLLQSFRDVLGGLRDFIVQRHIVDIPSPVPPILEETPPFMRALTFASMDTPGPYEKVAKEAFFNITLPEATWKAQQIEEHLQSFNRGTIISTAIHEAYPGHYVQFLWVQQAPSKVRKLLGANTNAEGWAHYCEQMMLEQGYGNNDPKLRLGQLQDALLRNARYIVGIQMHTGKMTFEQGVEFFVKEGYQVRATAERETKRGTSDPTYLVYTLGKLEILKLREDYRKLRGSQFKLGQFHDEFLKQGFPPIKIIRRAMLGDDSPVL